MQLKDRIKNGFSIFWSRLKAGSKLAFYGIMEARKVILVLFVLVFASHVIIQHYTIKALIKSQSGQYKSMKTIIEFVISNRKMSQESAELIMLLHSDIMKKDTNVLSSKKND